MACKSQRQQYIPSMLKGIVPSTMIFSHCLFIVPLTWNIRSIQSVVVGRIKKIT